MRASLDLVLPEADLVEFVYSRCQLTPKWQVSPRQSTVATLPGVTSATRALDSATRLAGRQRREVGEEFRERRLQLDQSQDHVAETCRMSRVHYGRIENGQATGLTLDEINRIAAALGLSLSLRIYPAGSPVRDAAQSTRLLAFLSPVAPPLRYRLEVPLPSVEDRFEQRAWDAVLFGEGARTAIELEMRLRDIQALIRRVDLKRRDDPTESFVLLIADTRRNRRVLAEYWGLFLDLPRMKPSRVMAALKAGEHPPTGLLLVRGSPSGGRAPG